MHQPQSSRSQLAARRQAILAQLDYLQDQPSYLVTYPAVNRLLLEAQRLFAALKAWPSDPP